MASENAVTENRRAVHFLLTSLCIHVTAFILLSMVVLNSVPEPRDFVSVQLMKAAQQVRKLRRDVPKLRSQTVNRVDLPRKSQDVARPLINQGSIPAQVATEVIPVFQYEPAEPKKPRMYPQVAFVREPLLAPKIATSKPVVRSPEESIFEVHDQLLKLSSPYSPASLSARRASDSAILQDFLKDVSRRIERSKRYPRWAMDAGLEGKVVVRFTILRDGELDEEIQLARSSGAEVLDNAAIAAIREAAPFPALPRSLSRERLQIELPMDFRLTES